MSTLLSLILSTLAVLATAYILPGVHITGFLAAFVAAIVLGIANSVLLPLLLLITLPINLLTLGLFTFVVIGFLVMAVSAIVPGFTVDSFWWALAFALVLFVINSFIRSIT